MNLPQLKHIKKTNWIAIILLSSLLSACVTSNTPVKKPLYSAPSPTVLKTETVPPNTIPYQPVQVVQKPVYEKKEPAPWVKASSYIVIDADSGRLLASKNANQRRAVASTQKLLTALVVLRDKKLDGTLTVATSDTWAEPTKLHIQAGQKYTRRALLNTLLVKSANDVAKALARDCAGSSALFARRMNAYARQLGCYNSNFKNPNGLTLSGQYSTAADIAKIAKAAWRSPFIRSVVRKKSYTFRYSNGTYKYLKNTNKCLVRYSNCNGMKTGYTRASGRCLVSSASGRGKNVIVVQLGSTSSVIWSDAIKLMKWGLAY